MKTEITKSRMSLKQTSFHRFIRNGGLYLTTLFFRNAKIERKRRQKQPVSPFSRCVNGHCKAFMIQE